MRVISGKYKGKKIEGFDIDGTRPTQDRIKESMFALIQNEISDAVCLDLFAGSGQLGIEAISNGSSRVYFVDNNSKCISILNNNLKDINDNYQVLNMDYNKALDYFLDNNIKFDIILLDPPYKLDCISNVLESVIEKDLLNKNGIIVCEYEYNNFEADYLSLELIKDKKYGYKNIRIYRKIEE